MRHMIAEFFAHRAVNEAMQMSWDDICSDTHCHPMDIKHGSGKELLFQPHHWADQIAKRLLLHATQLLAASPVPSAPSQNAEITRLRRDCAELYQVLGVLTEHGDLTKALDNALAAAQGRPRPHDDLLPFTVSAPPAPAADGWRTAADRLAEAFEMLLDSDVIRRAPFNDPTKMECRAALAEWRKVKGTS
jgi:hypothetical protein